MGLLTIDCTINNLWHSTILKVTKNKCQGQIKEVTTNKQAGAKGNINVTEDWESQHPLVSET